MEEQTRRLVKEDMELGVPNEDKVILLVNSRRQDFILEKSTKVWLEGTRYVHSV